VNRTIIFYVIGLVLFFGIHHLSGQNSFKVTTIPKEVRNRLDLDEFYKKHLKLEGFSIIGSAKVSDFALKEAAFLIRKIVGNRNELLTRLNKNKVRFVVMARDEYTTDVPEHSDLKPTKYWNRRARGLGATFPRPAVSCGEENLLGLPGDPYPEENILIHEFAHALHNMALIQIDSSFQKKLEQCFNDAIEQKIWEGTYASKNVNEYWAEGVQSWFNTNRENDREHGSINTRDELKKADPQLANLIEKKLGDSKWRYKLPHKRVPRSSHFIGYEPKGERPFTWP
jgi:hypothetical protein